jgi:dihydrofolate reductase
MKTGSLSEEQMGIVILDMAMSLDGFIAGPNNDDAGLYNWYFAPAPPSAAVIEELIKTLGAIIMGRHTYETGEEAGGFADDPYTAARFVLTHRPPEQVNPAAASFTFVADGIESALRQAKAAAGEKDVAIGGGANIAQQYLKAGLVDEIQLHIVPKLLGDGLRLFDHLGTEPVQLEITRVIESVGVTHLRYRVVK